MKEARALADTALKFRDLLNEIWGKELQHKKSGIQTKRLLEKDALPAWGERNVDDLKRWDIVQLLDKIKER
ncbi:MAG: hypothetical protein OEY01_05055, partial [Desulfobulbaceae bacterium]|nr:hypothetical protein [Desulfobulbaceae bacterium]